MSYNLYNDVRFVLILLLLACSIEEKSVMKSLSYILRLYHNYRSIPLHSEMATHGETSVR
jgi:hypothetical protein